jgi:hypothetical protein
MVNKQTITPEELEKETQGMHHILFAKPGVMLTIRFSGVYVVFAHRQEPFYTYLKKEAVEYYNKK